MHLNQQYKKQMEKTSQKKQKTTVGGGGKDKDGAWMCLHSVEAVGDAIELGKGILDEDLLDNPPDGCTVGDVVVHALRHS